VQSGGGESKPILPQRNEGGQFVREGDAPVPKIEVKSIIDFDPLVSKLSKAIADAKKTGNQTYPLRDSRGRFTSNKQSNIFQNILAGRGITGQGYTESEAKAAALEIAKSTNQGFIEGLEKEDPGSQFGKNFLDSVKQSLGINSPSKEAEDLASQFVAGWAIGLRSLGIATDQALDEQGKRFRKNLRSQIIESRDRDAKGRFVQRPVKTEPQPVTEDYWGDLEHTAINAYQIALEKSYARDVGPSVQDWVRKLFGGDQSQAEAETRKEIRKRKRSRRSPRKRN
jgi:hypothetical protein